MARSRRNSLVQSIASHPVPSDSQAIPGILDDTYLFSKLQKLSLSLEGENIDNQSANSEEKVVEPPMEPDSMKDKYQYYTAYLAQLDANIEEHKLVLDHTRKVSDQFVEVLERFSEVSRNTSQFVTETKTLYDDYKNMTKLSQLIPESLKYFDVLDPIMRRLNHATSPTTVKRDSFKNMLVSIDESLRFLEAHPDFKDTETYRIKFKQSLIRACELISTYLKNLLRQSLNDIMDKKSSLSTGTRDALLYNKFATVSESYKLQVTEIVNRINDATYARYHDEMESILNECYEQYFQIRSKLLRDMIWAQLDQTIIKDKDAALDRFIQDNKSYFQQLCTNEYNLFVKFFPEDQCRYRVNEWFLQLCEPLYDCVRTRVLREVNIPQLCDSVTLFARYYEFEENSEEYLRQFKDVQFDKVFEPIVQKLQARLILRVQVYVEQYIVKYQPPKDVFKITNRRVVATSNKNTNNNTQDVENEAIVNAYIEKFNIRNQESDGTVLDIRSYYPPLVTALALLSKIFEMINSVVFDDLAHHIVHDCVFSLRKAYNIAIEASPNSNNFEVKLAYMKNLLMFKDQIQEFNIQFTVQETYLDFSGLGDFFKSVKENGRDALKRSDSSSMLSFARGLVPKVVNNMVDARFELIHELRYVIKEFTDCVTKDIIGDCLDLSPGHSGNLLAKNIELRENIERKIPHFYNTICDYISDHEIVVNLLEAIQEVIIQEYSNFYDQVNDQIDNGTIQVAQVSELMFVDVFADFFNNVTRKTIINGGNNGFDQADDTSLSIAEDLDTHKEQEVQYGDKTPNVEQDIENGDALMELAEGNNNEDLNKDILKSSEESAKEEKVEERILT